MNKKKERNDNDKNNYNISDKKEKYKKEKKEDKMEINIKDKDKKEQKYKKENKDEFDPDDIELFEITPEVKKQLERSEEK